MVRISGHLLYRKTGHQSIYSELELDPGKYVVLSIFMSSNNNSVLYGTYNLTFSDGITVDKELPYGSNRKLYYVTVTETNSEISYSTSGVGYYYVTITAIKLY